MKNNPAFSLQSIGDVYLLVPLQDETFQKERIIPTNEVGALLWKTLQEECTEETLSQTVSEEYDISKKDALQDIRLFLQKLKSAGALLDTSLTNERSATQAHSDNPPKESPKTGES